MQSSSEQDSRAVMRDTMKRAGSVLSWFRSRGGNGNSVPPVGRMLFGSLRRTRPISDVWGSDRGHVIDRYYIEQFLTQHGLDVRGHVLEIAGDGYTRRFGGSRVTKIDVLHVADRLPNVTLVADLTSADVVPSATFDCIILTQTLHTIYDLRAAVREVHRLLKIGGGFVEMSSKFFTMNSG